MDYPSDFPVHLQRSVDAIIATAEIEFIDAKTAQSNTVNEAMLFRYIAAVVFGFAEQCVQAGRDGHWNGERIRKALAEFLDVVIDRTFRDKHPSWTKDSTTRYRFREEAIRASKDWKDWREIHKSIAEVFAAPMPIIGKEGGRRGYRREVQAWMTKQQIPKVEVAARRLAISKSALKSIMSDKGKLRCSHETLDRVLRTIGVSKG